jgi:hypothetical protein
MNIIKIQTERKEISEVEFTLPHFRVSASHAFMVYSKDNCINVCRVEGIESIGNNHAGLAFVLESDECDHEQFANVYKDVQLILNAKALII